VDVASGTDVSVLQLQEPLRVVGFLSGSVYMTKAVWDDKQVRASGLWRFVLSTRQLKQITTDDHDWTPATARLAWAIGREERPGLLPGDGNTILRLDLQSGAIEKWYSAGPDGFLGVNGFDAGGRPVITETHRGPVTPTAPVPRFEALLLLQGKNQTRTLVKDHAGDPEVASLDAAGRDSVIWFAGVPGVFSYSEEKGLTTLASGVGHGFRLAGTCG
jgi:hypothetical protein